MNKLNSLIIATALAMNVNANESLTSLELVNGAYETNESRGGDLSSIKATLLLESPDGSFHRSKIYSSYEASSSPGNNSDELLGIEYNLGKFWYPKATANDYSIWSGIGHWEFGDSIGINGSSDRNTKIVYIPLGFEGGLPISYPKFYFVYGADIKAVVTGTVNIDGTKADDASGFAYAGWIGIDYQMDSGNVFYLKMYLENHEIDETDYEYSSNLISIGYRF